MINRDIVIEISKQTRMVNCLKGIIGNDGENLQGNIIFEFKDEFVDGIARLEYEIDGEKRYVLLRKEENRYIVPIRSVLTKSGQINMQLVITEEEAEEEIPIFKSNYFYVYCGKSINAEIEEPSEYADWIEMANQNMIKMNKIIVEAEQMEREALQLDADVRQLEQDLNNLDIEVDNLDNNINLLANDIDTHTEEINALEQNYSILHNELLEQEDSINHLDDSKADKSTIYTKEQIDELIGALENVKIEVVEDLPEIGKTNIIYFVHRPDAQFDDTYNEYIWENNQYELIGNTAIDLSDYYTKEEVDGKGYATTSTLIAGINSCEPKMADSVDYIIETGLYGGGESGYRKYKNGIIEQWGVATTQANETEFTMHKPHIDQKFSIFIEPREQGNFYHYAMPSANQKFKCRIQSRDSVSMAIKFQWRSFGKWK